MEEQILHYYSKIFSLFLIFFLFFISLFIFNSFNKNLILIKNPINIERGENLEEILNKNIYNLSLLDVELIKIYFKIIIFLEILFTTVNLILKKILIC